MSYKILAINPGSTSTQIALYEDEKEIFSENVAVEPAGGDKPPIDTFNMLKDGIVKAVEARGYDMREVDAFSGRQSGSASCAMGVYEVNDRLRSIKDVTKPQSHPSSYTVALIDAYEKAYGGKAMAINAQSVDELQDVARITGYCGKYREVAFHALNQKEIGQRFAEKAGKPYDQIKRKNS